ncbi:hypothetical protein JCM10908_000548 [Rhodotorula pacifica]|uniref:uncharacterized protein n=1 Tax=Rhodotorula pacifica TaxID=1495444 RepID=UPI00317C2395
MKTAGALYTAGIAAYRATSYETAVELFTQAISLAPNSPKLYDARASAFDKLGKLQEGLLDTRQVIRLLPTAHKGYIRAARMLKVARKYAKAEAVLLQGLERVPSSEKKGRLELETELAATRDVRAQAELSPISQLPLEIFVDIISLVAEARPSAAYSHIEIPRRRKARPSNLFTCMRVCRAWRRSILTTPRFWTTLSIDGNINSKNAERKAQWVAQRASGRPISTGAATEGRQRSSPLALASGGSSGLQRLVITAAQEMSDQAFEAVLVVVAASDTLREVVCSFADGVRTTSSVQTEARRSSRLVNFLHEHARGSLRFLAICTGGRIYPDFDLGSFFAAFPNLESLNLRGSTVSAFVVGVNASFLRPSLASLAPEPADSSGTSTGSQDLPPSPPSSRARSVVITGAVFVSDTACHLASFPELEHLELDIVGAATTWQLLSAPRLKTYRATLYGESHVAELPIPDLAAAWSRVEDIRLGGAKRFANRLLQEAIRIGPLRFGHLQSLDLSFASLTNEHLSLLFDSTNAPVLETINLAGTTASPPEVKLVLPARLDALKKLNISHTAWASDETIRALITSAPRLESLEVRGNVSLGGRPLMELVRARMDLSQDGSEPASGQYSKITTLALEGCTKIETPAVEWLKKHIRPGGVKFQFIDPTERRSSYCY